MEKFCEAEFYCDVAVCGGGVAGAVTAIASALNGAETVLIEKELFLGGDNYYAGVSSILTFHSKQGKKIVDGIPQKIIDNLVKNGTSKGHVADIVGVAGSVTPVCVSAFSLELYKMCAKAGVKVLNGFSLFEAEIDSSSKNIKTAYLKNKDRYFAIHPKIWVDASGCGLLSKLCGGKFIDKNDDEDMPATLIFHVADVDIEKIKDYMLNNRDEFHSETRFDLLDNSVLLGCSGFFSTIKKAELTLKRDRVLFYQTLSPTEVSINMSRIPSFFATGPSEDCYAFAMSQICEIFDFLKRDVVGFENSHISYIFPKMGLREQGRVEGKYILSKDDVSNGHRFEDEIAYGGFPIDIHKDSDSGLICSSLEGEGFYGIPYRVLVSNSFDNLFTVGKCLSADFESHASVRVQASLMALGEATGTASALCAKQNKKPEEIEVKELRDLLRKNGACIM